MEENIVRNEKNENRLLRILLEIGERLLSSGAEVNRVEDTLERIGLAYGAERMNVFVITSSVIITMERDDGTLLTHTRRITKSGTDFQMLEKLNALSRQCCTSPVPLEELEYKLNSCILPKKRWELYLGSILAAGSFAVFFGGNLADSLAAAVFAVLICLFQEKGSQFLCNNVMFNLVCSFLTGTLICLTVKCIPYLHVDKIMIGDIMLLIPGIAITNAIRDMLMGDTIAGIMRLIESILWAGALASGFMASIWMVGI